jgi:hypothetical protein
MSEEKTLDELLTELTQLSNTALPSVEQFGGWAPFDILEGADVVLASRDEGEHHFVKPFKAEGDWKAVHDYFLKRNQLWAEIDRQARREEPYMLVVDVKARKVSESESTQKT